MNGRSFGACWAQMVDSRRRRRSRGTRGRVVSPRTFAKAMWAMASRRHRFRAELLGKRPQVERPDSADLARRQLVGFQEVKRRFGASADDGGDVLRAGYIKSRQC